MNDMEAFAMLGAALGIIVGALLYLFSKILSSTQLKRYALMFILEAFLTVVLAFSLFNILPYADQFGAQLSSEFFKSAGILITNNSDETAANIALAFYTQKLQQCYLLAYGQFSVLYGLSHAIVGKMHVGGMMAYGPSNYMVWTTIKFFLQILFYVILMVYFIAKLIIFFNAYGPFLISLGVIVRAFEPAKSLGAYLIALGLGFYLIFPLSLNIGASVFYNPVWCKQIMNTINTTEYKDTISALYGDAFKQDLNRHISIGEWYSRMRQGISLLFSSFTTFFKLIGLSIINPESASQFLYNIVATNFYSVFVAFVITLSFVNITTTALGGRISEIGRGFFKLV